MALHFLETGDKVAAIQAAFNSKSKDSARAMANTYFKKPRVVAFLNLAAPHLVAKETNGQVGISESDDEDSVTEPDNGEPLVLDGVKFPHEASQRIRAMSRAERKKWDADRFRCQTDPIYLSDVLGMDLQPDPHEVLFKHLITCQGPKFPMSELDRFHKKMVLWSRGTCKTTSLRVCMVSVILNYPDARLCFLTGGDQLAKRQLLALKLVFEKPTDRFKYLFPEFCFTSILNKKTKEWTDVQEPLGTTQQFTVPARSSTVYAEPTFVISSARSIKSGSHYNFLFIDDLVNDQNYQNAAALEKCYQQYLDTLPLLDPTGYIVMTGTRYSFGDTYERIQENAQNAGDLSNWHFSIRDCWSQGKCSCGHSDVYHDRDVNAVEPPCMAKGCTCRGFVGDAVKACLFPRVTLPDGRLFGHTLEFLFQQKAELGEGKFANQYENRPIAEGQQTFTETMIGAQTIFQVAQLPPVTADTFIMGDLGYSTDEDRDETVLFVFKKFAGALWVYDCVAGHFGSNEFIQRLLMLMLKHRPKEVFLEKNYAADALNNLLIARAPEFGVFRLPITWVPQSNVKGAKHSRIANIQTMFVGKRLWLYAAMPNYDRLVRQLLRFPRSGGHDDFPDCLGMACELPLGWSTEQLPSLQQQSAGNWLRKLHGVTLADDSYYDHGAGSGLCCS